MPKGLVVTVFSVTQKEEATSIHRNEPKPFIMTDDHMIIRKTSSHVGESHGCVLTNDEIAQG